MTRTSRGKDKRTFSIELRSKRDVKNISLDGDEKVLIEGSIGSLIRVQFLEDLVLEVVGSNGELRLDLGVNDLHQPQKAELEEEGGSRR